MYLKPRLGLDGVVAAETDLVMVADIPDTRRVPALFARWMVTFLAYGAVGWNFVRKSHLGGTEPVPFDVEVLISDGVLARPVADKAGDLYRGEVTDPLVEAVVQVVTSSPPTPTDVSTSQTPKVSRKRSGSSSPLASVGEPSPTIR